MNTYAQAAQHGRDGEGQRRSAHAAWNLAALIAADCGLPGVAARWCKRQFRLLQQERPVQRRDAIHTLQPLLNLIRLTARSGDLHQAHRELCALYEGALHGGSTHIHGLAVDFDDLCEGRSQDQEVSRWLDVAMLEDGTRLLARTGQWDRAAEHAHTYDRSGGKAGEHFQAQVIAHLAQGRFEEARTLVDAAPVTQLWEHAVIACLRGYGSLLQGRFGPSEGAHLREAVQEARIMTETATALFGFRLGLVAAELLVEHPAQVGQWCTELLAEAVASDDAFLAREALEHPLTCARAAAEQKHTLARRIRAAGLGQKGMSRASFRSLAQAVHIAEEVLRCTRRSPG
ncbi:hypothetical protein [Nocardiopsis algeriensis]|uniref:Uncharacterized protein n=1 Tax=Nocardiopsis algeriensis TaxID=1478215 RepID=A0A841J0R0_9ACTN|nr:hypothetical protein [Nocardiopsis algeriensis]MBB6122265.1 hypothetical protein [Nocardiopsis algeriensis]